MMRAALALAVLLGGCAAALDGGEIINAGSVSCRLVWKQRSGPGGQRVELDQDTLAVCRRIVEEILKGQEDRSLPKSPSRKDI